ncbi:MAG TPA: phosphoenolpyruvate carboxykinase (ATP), partial [Candidatus Poseidoniales archaeon]
MRSGGVTPPLCGEGYNWLNDFGIDNYDGEIHWNLEWEDLYAAAIRRNEGELTAHGVLKTVTGERTGRSPNDRYIVKLH